VIERRHGIQWILQRRNQAETVARHVWRGRSYCRPKEALNRCCDEHAGQIDPAARMMLEALPERINSESGFLPNLRRPHDRSHYSIPVGNPAIDDPAASAVCPRSAEESPDEIIPRAE
jgi:hypothetical protein